MTHKIEPLPKGKGKLIDPDDLKQVFEPDKIEPLNRITAKVSYRGYVPSGWFALEYCHVTFYNDKDDIYEDKWHAIEYSQYDDATAKIEAIDRKINTLNKNSKWWQFFKTQEAIHKLLVERKSLEESRFKDAIELFSDAEEFLSDNGFTLINSSQSGGEVNDEIYIWEKR